jgi:hypothetical protein
VTGPSHAAPLTQFRERTALARQRSSLALVLIAMLLLTHSHAGLAVVAAGVIAAAGLAAHTPRTLTAASGLAAVAAAAIVVL